MPRPFRAALVLGLALAATASSPRQAAARLQTTLDYDTLDAFALGLGADTFRGRLSSYPDLSSCHTQGIAIADGQLIISCTMFGSNTDRDVNARSLLLRASLAAIEARVAPIPWHIVDITAPARRSKGVLGHPSGLAYDGVGVWCANAVYAPESESQLVRYDPRTLAPMMDSGPIDIDDHIGTLATVPNSDSLLAFNWDSKEVYQIGLRESSVTPRLHACAAAYQDCDGSSGHMLCGGLVGLRGVLDDLDDSLALRSRSHLRRPPFSLSTRLLTKGGFAMDSTRSFAYFLPDDVPDAKLIRVAVDPG